ncbi:conserved membrane hypothetical protein [Candidatus Nitrosotenuis uzonensis]|uniref:Probable membrane transporter protein n=1 Tax=Candidatus Nitrosotenuis uzonensis TaxID=1407055 RepID=V6ATF5_9ARCH|nr:conserved membrane hypothetical protein [Candidatus Nitrosotenuis uzonensis]
MLIVFDIIWLIPLGFAAGVVGSIIGLGGGIIVVPVLTFLGVPHTITASSSLFAAFSNSIAASASYAKQKRVDYKIGLRLGLLSVPGTVIGALISAQVTPAFFKITFGIILIASCYYLFIKRKIEPKSSVPKYMAVASAAISFFAGILSSFFGIGGGIVFVPLMIIGLGMLVKNATATSQLILIFSSLSGLVAHTLLGHSDFEYALLLSIGAFGGGLLGARLSVELKENSIRLLICGVIVIAAIKLFLDAFNV